MTVLVIITIINCILTGYSAFVFLQNANIISELNKVYRSVNSHKTAIEELIKKYQDLEIKWKILR